MFSNRARLPFFITQPQFPDEKTVTTLADGSTKTRSVVVTKVYAGKTASMPERIHERLKIALVHDTVNIEGDRYFGGVTPTGDYDISWENFMDRPVAQAEFKVQVTPFDATNSNCKSCDEANQIILVDDVFPDPLDQNHTYALNVFANDTVGCSPYTATIVTFDPNFLVSAAISEMGVITIVTKAAFIIANGVKLLTYRVLCPNGGFDEADVYANMNGTVEACLAPTNVRIVSTTDNSVTMAWDAPTPAPAGGYDWVLSKGLFGSGGSISQQGNTATLTVTVNNLSDATDYNFGVRGHCDADSQSQYKNINVKTESQQDSCGLYNVTITPKGLDRRKNVTYIACNGQVATKSVAGHNTEQICCLEISPGVPSSITGATFIDYVRPC